MQQSDDEDSQEAAIPFPFRHLRRTERSMLIGIAIVGVLFSMNIDNFEDFLWMAAAGAFVGFLNGLGNHESPFRELSHRQKIVMIGTAVVVVIFSTEIDYFQDFLLFAGVGAFAGAVLSVANEFWNGQ